MTVGSSDQHLASRAGQDRRPDRRRVRHRPRCVHRRGRHDRRPGEDPEPRPGLPRRDRGGRGLHRPERDPHQRPLPAGDHPDGELARAEDWVVSPITLRHGCSIGAGAVVVAGTDVGRFATVGAGSVVTRACRPTRWSPAARPPHRLGLRLRRSACATRTAPAPPRATPASRAARAARPRYTIDRATRCVGAGHGGARMIPIARPDIGQEESDAVAEVIRSGMIARAAEGRSSKRPGPTSAASGTPSPSPTGRVALMAVRTSWGSARATR